MLDEDKPIRHVCGISGGKDSAALAIYLKEKRDIPNIEYFFSDTGKELPEVYDFLDRLEAYLGQEIVRIGTNKPFEHYLKLYGGFLPSPQQRWCTREMKIRPFEQWVGDDQVITYVGIRADEARDGYVSTKPNIRPVFPFKEDGLVKADILRILEGSVGVPEYYSWRSRSGCYFCFFQRRGEWRGLKENHPDLFAAAKSYEKSDALTGKSYSWVQGVTLAELEQRWSSTNQDVTTAGSATNAGDWQQAVVDEPDDEDGEGCVICHI